MRLKKPFKQTKACSASQMPLGGAISVLSSLCSRKSRILTSTHFDSGFLKSTMFPNSHNIADIRLFVVIITVVLSHVCGQFCFLLE